MLPYFEKQICLNWLSLLLSYGWTRKNLRFFEKFFLLCKNICRFPQRQALILCPFRTGQK